MPPLPQDVAGELGRYVRQLKKSLEGVQQERARVRTEIRLENVEAQLLAQLTPEEQAALDRFLQKKNLAELQAHRDLLIAQQAALEKAIGLLEAELAGR